MRDEKCQRLQNENRHLLESLAIMLSTPSRFVESLEGSIKERIRELLTENKDKTAVGYGYYMQKLRLQKSNLGT